jgi:hypothetical protein
MENRSGVLYRLRAAQLLVSFLGMALSSYLLRKNVWLQCFIGEATLIVMLPLTALLHESIPISIEKPLVYASIDPDSAAAPSQEDSETTSLLTRFPPPDAVSTSVLSTVSHALVENITHTITLFQHNHPLLSPLPSPARQCSPTFSSPSQTESTSHFLNGSP